MSKIAGALVFMCLLFSLCVSASAEKVVVIVANRTTLSDFVDEKVSPNVVKMIKCGAIGLISPNCSGPKHEGSVMFTAAAGTSIGVLLQSKRPNEHYVDISNQFYLPYEYPEKVEMLSASDIYKLRTGFLSRDNSNLLFLELPRLLKLNKNKSGYIGLLAESLKKANKKTTFRSTKNSERLTSALIMDSKGIVERNLPFYSDLEVINVDETMILDKNKDGMSEVEYRAKRLKELQKIDDIVKKYIQQCNEKTKLVLISFSPPSGRRWHQLTPIIIYPFEQSILVSPTTRTIGLIAASDFAATILGLMNLGGLKQSNGMPALVIRDEKNLEKVIDLDRRTEAQDSLIRPVLWVFAGIVALSYTLSAILITFYEKRKHAISKSLQMLLIFASTAPLAMLLAVLSDGSVGKYTKATFLSAVVLSIVAFLVANNGRIRRLQVRSKPIVVVFLATFFVMSVDALMGCRLCKFALPSFYQVSGYRYYGIGNEYAGVFISASALLCLFGVRYFARKELYTFLIAIIAIFVLGFGFAGANYGAVVSAVVTFTLIVIAFKSGGFGASHVSLILAVLVAFIFAIFDRMANGLVATHGGKLVSSLDSSLVEHLIEMAKLKIELHVSLLEDTNAILAVLVFLPFLGLWFWKIKSRLKNAFRDVPDVYAGLKAILIGAVAAFIFNDSGIVFAGVMIAVLMLPLLYLLLENPKYLGETFGEMNS